MACAASTVPSPDAGSRLPGGDQPARVVRSGHGPAFRAAFTEALRRWPLAVTR